MKLRYALLLALVSACASGRGDRGAALQHAQSSGVELVFAGALSFDAERLSTVASEDLERLPRAPNRRAVLDDAAFALQRFYRREGFADAEVAFQDLGSEAERSVRFDVREGPRVLVDGFEFPGANALTFVELTELYAAPRVGDRSVLVSSAVTELANAIEERYVARGYARVELDPPKIEREIGAAHARVSITVREGAIFRVGNVTWNGDLGALKGELDDLGRRERDAVFNSQALGSLATRASELFAERGYPQIRVRPVEEHLTEDSKADVAFEVETGPKVTISAIDVRGNEHVARELVLSRVAFREGRLWRASDERDSLRELFRTGLFSAVEFAFEGTGELRTLVVRVREASSREFSVEPGYGSYERLRLGLGWRDKNWLGTARALNFDSTLAELAQRASLSLVDLHLFESDIEGVASIFGGRRIEPSFTSSDFGGSLTLTRNFSRHTRGILGYQFRHSGVSDVDANVSSSDLVQDVDISSLLVTPTYDDRDQYFLPTKGTFAQLSVEYGSGATGSQLDFVRTRWTASQFLSLSDAMVVAGSWRGGVIAPFGGTDTIPLQERFFNGGENSVRAFREDDIGPIDGDGEPLGGEAFNVFSLELRRELAGNLDGAVFWDAGDVSARAGDFLKFEDLRHGPGVGLRYRLPIGPVRLDLGYNPDVQGTESRWVLHLSVGMSF
ncbi:MAG: BamA/TamA family outer membrane protein [Planctomycetes bacterium]|nr:BamA/TamA family outer membrane protein [Planctomycetota bacterium]